jgi:hypothetical protein
MSAAEVAPSPNAITSESVRTEFLEVWGLQVCPPGDWSEISPRVLDPAPAPRPSKVRLDDVVSVLTEADLPRRLGADGWRDLVDQLAGRKVSCRGYRARFEEAVAALVEAYANGPLNDGASIIFLHAPFLSLRGRIELDRRLSALARKPAAG